MTYDAPPGCDRRIPAFIPKPYRAPRVTRGAPDLPRDIAPGPGWTGRTPSPRLPACLLLLALSACTTTGGSPTSGTPDRAAATERIESIVDDWSRAWVVEDPVPAASGYSDDAEFTNAFGFHRTGREAIEAYLTEVFAMDFVMAGDSREVFREVDFLGPDVALRRSKVERTGQTTSEGESLGVRQTSHLRVFQRRSGEWKLVSHLISDARATGSAEH